MKRLVRRAIAEAIARLPPGILTDEEHVEIFRKRGIHIMPDNFYQPIPNIDKIDPRLWDIPSSMVGIDRRQPEQLKLFNELAGAGYFVEFERLPGGAPSAAVYGRKGGTGGFNGLDAAVYFALIRRLKPNNIIEIGAGHSTLLALEALAMNETGHLTSIDPFPQSYLRGRSEFTLVPKPVESVPLSLFESLHANDMLFIDSSHVVKIGGDVTYEILEILPRLKRGVHIHVHDVFLPNHYPKDWVMNRRIYWTEQYLVQAFLAFNKLFEITWSSAMMQSSHGSVLESYLSDLDGASLWLRRA